TKLYTQTTGLYDFTVTGDIDTKWLLHIDGKDTGLTGSGLVSVYLRPGPHTVYLRAHKGASAVNAFKVRITLDDDFDSQTSSIVVSDVMAVLPKHGRFTAVYSDPSHEQRLGQSASPSSYTAPSLPLDHANALMGTGVAFGLMVSMGAEHLADYMMRDILTSRLYLGRTRTPMTGSAGKVLFSTDMVPDTIFTGESENSILEDFLEASGYVVVDGNSPFCIISHSDGTTTQIDGTQSSGGGSGAEMILDLSANALVKTDDFSQTYDYHDVETPLGQFLSEESTEKDAWAESFTYGLYSTDVPEASSQTWTISIDQASTTITAGAFQHNTDGFLIPPGDLWLDLTFRGYSANPQDVHYVKVQDLSFQGKSVSTAVSSSEEGRVGKTYDCTTLDYEWDDVLGWRCTYSVRIPVVDSWLLPGRYTRSHFIEQLDIELGFSAALAGMYAVDLEVDFFAQVDDAIHDQLRMTLPVAGTGVLEDIEVAMVSDRNYGIAYWQTEIQDNLPISIYEPGGSSPYLSATLQETSLVYLNSGNISGQGKTFSSTLFEDPGQSPYRVDIDASTSQAPIYLQYIWKHRTDGSWTTSDGGGLNWALHMPLQLTRNLDEVVPTDFGRMVLGDIEDYKPDYSFNTAELKNLGRKYIDYASRGGTYCSFSSPITLQADQNGGGVMSYGLSSKITYDHLAANSSLVGPFMQIIAQYNHMNLWGAAPTREAISSASVSVIREDNFVAYGKSSWVVKY
ncbi:MAG: hypothetical protein ACE5IO_09020, partial [Thermoplasmata archaeon]